MRQNVQPIKDKSTLAEVQDTLKHNFKYGIRNYTIFQVGKTTMLRVSDVLRLKYNDIFDDDGTIKRNVLIHDKKTGKLNQLYLKPVENDLNTYHKWLLDNEVQSEWLFPSSQRDKHVDERQFYRIMQKVGDLLGLDYLGTHTMRKTGAYMVYVQTNYNIGLVMRLLNHSSELMTLRYLGLDRENIESTLDKIHFNY
jgi:integrase